MSRNTQQTGASSTYAAQLKPAFTPGLLPLEALDTQVYLDTQVESYDSQGAPRLHQALADADDANPLVRVTLNGSDLTPAIRRVFIPNQATATSFVVEWVDAEPGLVVLALTGTGGNALTASVTYLPFTRLSDISQGDHEGLLQITVPTTGMAQTQLTVQQNGAGDLQYATANTVIVFEDLSSEQKSELKRFLDLELGAELATACGAFGFDLPDTVNPRTSLDLAIGISSGFKKAAIGVLQVGGLVATGLSFAFGPVAAGIGGALRGVAGLTGLVTPQDDDLEDVAGRGAPMVLGRKYVELTDLLTGRKYFTQ